MNNTGKVGAVIKAFDPYGAGWLNRRAGQTKHVLDLGRTQVLDDCGRSFIEHYQLMDDGQNHWLRIESSAQHAYLAVRYRKNGDLDSARFTAISLLEQLWQLRQPKRLRLLSVVEFGDLTAADWRALQASLSGSIEAPIASDQTQPLESFLRQQGHRVDELIGAMGTKEFVLRLGA